MKRHVLFVALMTCFIFVASCSAYIGCQVGSQGSGQEACSGSGGVCIGACEYWFWQGCTECDDPDCDQWHPCDADDWENVLEYYYQNCRQVNPCGPWCTSTMNGQQYSLMQSECSCSLGR